MTTHCNLFVARTSTGFVIRVHGSGTSAHSPALAEFIVGCFGQDPQSRVTVDLMACEYLDSTFLGCLLKLQRAGTDERFQVVADDTTRKKLLATTHLDAYLTLVQKAPQPVSKFLRIEAKPLSQRELGQHIMEAHEELAEVPSDAAIAFRQIATQLKCELEKQDRNDPSLTDTVVMRVRKRS